MITTGTVIIKFVEHIALSESSGMWQYSVIDRVANADKPTWHKIQQYYEKDRPDPKRVGTAYKVRITKSKRERFQDRDGVWQDKGEVFIIEENGWAPADTLYNPERHDPQVFELMLNSDSGITTVGDIMNRFPGEAQLYIVDKEPIHITHPSGIIKYDAVLPYYYRQVVMIEYARGLGYLLWV